mmetsp:Transcript_4751/g.8130  ORF Transcript_4751/g.8130 Transcript_4751/m.8130 type:complete len:283 (-) Transcript_4751:595-1443(-)
MIDKTLVASRCCRGWSWRCGWSLRWRCSRSLSCGTGCLALSHSPKLFLQLSRLHCALQQRPHANFEILLLGRETACGRKHAILLRLLTRCDRPHEFLQVSVLDSLLQVIPQLLLEATQSCVLILHCPGLLLHSLRLLWRPGCRINSCSGSWRCGHHSSLWLLGLRQLNSWSSSWCCRLRRSSLWLLRLCRWCHLSWRNWLRRLWLKYCRRGNWWHGCLRSWRCHHWGNGRPCALRGNGRRCGFHGLGRRCENSWRGRHSNWLSRGPPWGLRFLCRSWRWLRS